MALMRYARFAIIFHFQLNIQGRKLFKCRWFDKLASHFLAGLRFSHHRLSPPERGRGWECVQESRNGPYKKMCEQLLLLPVLLAVTFKCQDSYSPIRKDQSSHVEKRQHADFNFSHNCTAPLCLCQILSLQSISQHTQRTVTRQHYEYMLVTRNKARKHAQNNDR